MEHTTLKSKLLAALLAACLTLGGCADQSENTSEADSTPAPAEQAGGESADAPQTGGPVQIGTGRIVEEDISPAGLNANSQVRSTYLLPNGDIAMIERDGDGNRHAWHTADYGATWAEFDAAVYNAFMQDREYLIYTEAVDVNGSWWVGIQENDGLHLYILEEGETREVSLAGWTVAGAPDAFALGFIPVEGGMLVAVQSSASLSASFCAVNFAGDLGAVFTPGIYPESYSYNSGLLYCALSGEPAIEVYDVAGGELLRTITVDMEPDATGSYLPAGFAATADGSFMYMDTDGIHTLSAEGAPGEDIASSRGFSYAWPNFWARDLLAMPDGSIVASVYNGTAMGILHYRFDPDAPVYETQTLTVWCLEESPIIEAAAFAFIKRNPDFEVEIEIGRNEENGALGDEDLVRELNLRILGGNPPDVLVLDGLNAAAFIKAGALMDISAIVDKTEFYAGVIDSFIYEGANYAYPALFRPPVLAADADQAALCQAATASLDALAQLCLEESAITLDNYGDVFNTLYDAYSPLIFPGGDTVDEAALTAFMSAIDTIARGRGLTQATSDVWDKGTVTSGGKARVLQSNTSYGALLEARNGPPDFALYTPNYNFDIAGLYISRGDMELAALPGGGFMPVCTASVPAGAANVEAAEWFIAAMLEDEAVQRIGNDTLSGFAVKRGLLATQFEETRQKFTDTGDPDMEIKGDISGRDWDAFGDSFTAASVTDIILRQRVYEEVSYMCEGGTSLEGAISEVLQNTKLYFAERVS